MGGDHNGDRSFETCFNLGSIASTLVVRAWLEPVAGGAPILRGTIGQLGGRMLGAFDSVESLAALVERHVDCQSLVEDS